MAHRRVFGWDGEKKGCNMSWRFITFKMLVFIYFAFFFLRWKCIIFLVFCLLVFFMVGGWTMGCME